MQVVVMSVFKQVVVKRATTSGRLTTTRVICWELTRSRGPMQR